MNPHFRRFHDAPLTIPARAWGRVDHVEPSGRRALVAFDLIDADWLLQAGLTDDRFLVDDPAASARAWLAHPAAAGTASPFDTARLYRLEVELDLHANWFGFPERLNPGDPGLGAALGRLEQAWFEFDVSQAATPDAMSALLYPSFYAPGAPVWVKGRMPSRQQGQALSGIFSLGHLPALSTANLAGGVAAARADVLAVYDVGQGNANALVEDAGRQPGLYYDLGAGVYRNQHTTPHPLVFCFANQPWILLSHWDADHWAGAFATKVGGAYPALLRTWVAPLQNVGPVHVAFAHEVLAAGGSFSTYSAPAGTVGLAPLACGRLLKFTLGTGSNRNDSGLTLAVEDAANPLSPRSWILTGDCDYAHFMAALAPHAPVGLVAPHHGASLPSGALAPAPVGAGSYRRLVYSFGHNNAHGGGAVPVRHPTPPGVQGHAMSGWLHGAWLAATPGTPLPTADVRATNEHAPGAARGGVWVGWTAAPALVGPACGGVHCSVAPTQT